MKPTHPFQQYSGHTVPEDVQRQLNEPAKKADGLEETHRAFLQKLVSKLEDGTLNPLSIRTLYNTAVYQALPVSEQEAADITAMNLMSTIRQIDRLRQAGQHDTFQLQNLVDTVFRMKSAFEAKHGDVYVI